MYILSSLPCTPAELDRLLGWLYTMLHRAVLCLTAFLASAGIFTDGASSKALGVQGVSAQYLLGLGEYKWNVIVWLDDADVALQVLATLRGERGSEVVIIGRELNRRM